MHICWLRKQSALCTLPQRRPLVAAPTAELLRHEDIEKTLHIVITSGVYAGRLQAPACFPCSHGRAEVVVVVPRCLRSAGCAHCNVPGRCQGQPNDSLFLYVLLFAPARPSCAGVVKQKAFLSALEERLKPRLQAAGQLAALDTFKRQFDDAAFRKGLEITFTAQGDKLTTTIDSMQVCGVGFRFSKQLL